MASVFFLYAATVCALLFKTQAILDPCQNFTCLNGGSCTAPADAPSCICKPGFFGSKCEYNRDPCYNFNCTNGGYCTAPADAPYCVCPSGYTGTKCETQVPTTNGAVCPNGCPKGYSCEFKSPPCKPGSACLEIMVPTCVPPKDPCSGCLPDQECVDTKTRCITNPCQSFKCVTKTTQKPQAVCNLFCVKGYTCVVRVPKCDRSSTAVCSTTPVAQCVPVLDSCPKPGQILDPSSRACRRVVSSCQTDADCDPQSQRCCPNRCNKLTCTTVPKLQ
ncbi:fibropellin-1-like [Physella acuta]|uniref:fibropellin-1-like n=1 Tax=Physella acuta TaxID=109671 RepID=UPI0027DBB007|nr:fibropellin-1-like [Physella acuta]